jgi:hypothetical protein
MNNKRYKTAGWLSILVAVVFVPKFIMNFFFEVIAQKLHFPGVYLLDVFMIIILTVIYVYLLLSLRLLLNERYNFFDVDKLITISYCLLIAAGFITILDDILKTVGIIGSQLSTLKLILIICFFAVFFVMGIISIIFGIKLLRLKGDLFGMLKIYVYTTIAGGVCLVSILLFPLSLVMVVATYILEGIIFLRAAEDAEFV